MTCAYEKWYVLLEENSLVWRLFSFSTHWHVSLLSQTVWDLILEFTLLVMLLSKNKPKESQACGSVACSTASDKTTWNSVSDGFSHLVWFDLSSQIKCQHYFSIARFSQLLGLVMSKGRIKVSIILEMLQLKCATEENKYISYVCVWNPAWPVRWEHCVGMAEHLLLCTASMW